MEKGIVRSVFVLVVLAPVVLGPAAPLSGAAYKAPARSAPDAIVVDGVVDAEYGPPIGMDPAGDGNGNANMDLLNLYMSQDTHYFYVAFTINSDIQATNWGKYALYVDTTGDDNGATSDGWGRNVAALAPHRPEYGIYTYVDAPPYGPARTEVRHWTGTGWDPAPQQVDEAAIGAEAASVIEWKVSKAKLGNPGAMWVEVWDTGGGGGDNAQDTINFPAGDWDATNWSDPAGLAVSTPFIVIDGVHEGTWGAPAATDPLGDMTEPNLDLNRLYLAEDASSFYFGLDALASTWGMTYGIYLDTDRVSGSGATSDPWGRAVNAVAANLPEHTLYVWHDGADYIQDVQLNHWTGSAWTFDSLISQGGAQAYGAANDWLEYRVPRSAIGSPANVAVEAFTTGGNGHAQDTVPSDPNVAYTSPDWGGDTTTLSAFYVFPPLALALTVTSPAEEQRFDTADIHVIGQVTPAAGTSVTVTVNGTTTYTPALDPDGNFDQVVTLAGGDNTITVSATDGVNTETVVRHVSFGASHDDNIWWDGLRHDSRDGLYRVPFGAVPEGTAVKLRFRTFAGDVTGVKVRVWNTAQGAQTIYPMALVATIPGTPFDYDIWQLDLAAPATPTILYYRFIVADGTRTVYYEDDALLDGGLGQPYDNSPDYSWQIDVYSPEASTPQWFKDAVVYQIFPDRFRNGVGANDPISGTFFYGETPGVMKAPQWNWIVPDPRPVGPWFNSYSKLFYGGDLQGIADELDYIQALGANTLYLNPIFESPSNHKYDTTNYEQVDDNLGGNTAFQALIAALDARGMHLVLDGVFNHTSSDSRYFDRYHRYPDVGACEDVNSPYRSWYYFTPADPPGAGVCAGDTDYQSWWGFDSLPKLNTTDAPGVRDYLYKDDPAIGPYWLAQGADGWRLDVAGDVNATFWQDWRPYIRTADPEAITIAEDWGDASRFMLGDGLDSAMNYRFRNALIGLLRETDWVDTNSSIPALSVSEFDRVMHGMEEDYPREAWLAMLNLVDSHDTNRVLIPLDQDGDPTNADYSDGKARQKVLALIQMTMPGAPTIYYGDEVGLVGYGQASEGNAGGVYYSDPYNRQPYPWPDEPGYSALPAWRQQDTAMLAHYTTLAGIRNAHPALRTGAFTTLLTDDTAGVYAYGRKLGNDAAVAVANLGPAQAITVDVQGMLSDGVTLTDELNGGSYTVTGGQIAIGSLGAMWGAVLTVDGGQDLTPPAAPLNLAAVEGDEVVHLSWGTVPGAAWYQVYRSYVSGGGYELVAYAITNLVYDDGTVTNGTQYYYVVTAMDAAGNESVTSNEAGAMPHLLIAWANLQWPPTLPHIISALTPTDNIYGRVRIDGYTSDPGATPGLLAQVGYGPDGSNPDGNPAWVWVDATFNVDAGSADEFMGRLLPEAVGTYDYAYRYSTTAGTSWLYADLDGTDNGYDPAQAGSLTVNASSDTTPPAKPLGLAVTDWSTTMIELSWSPVTGDPTLYGYDVYRSGMAGGPYTRLGRVLAPAVTYTDEAVASGQTYYYVVRAVDTSFNRSDESNEAWGTTEAKMVQVTFQATVPPYTPAGATVYVVGDPPELCAWCSPQTIALTRTGPNTWARTITLPDGQPVQYKYTRGNWDVNEWWDPIVSTNNRHATVSYGTDGTQLLADTIPYWRDPLVIDHEPAADETHVDPSATIGVTLSRYLDPATITAENVVLSGPAVPPLDIGFFYHPEMTATTILITPTVPLRAAAWYHVALKTGLKGLSSDNEGIALQHEYSWHLATSGTWTFYLQFIYKKSPTP